MGFAALGVALVLFLVPVPPSAPKFSFEDKVAHFLIFAVLALWFLQLYRRHALLLVVLLMLFGGGVEGLQSLTEYRSADWWDFIADAIGVLGGWAALYTRAGSLAAYLDTSLTRWVNGSQTP